MTKKVEVAPGALENVFGRAETDPTFRARLLTDANAAVNEVAPHSVPRGVQVGFVEKPANVDALFVLPDAVGAPAALSATELEAVSGGTDQPTCEPEWTINECALTCQFSCAFTATD